MNITERQIKTTAVVLTVVAFLIYLNYCDNPYASSRLWSSIMRRRHTRGTPHTAASAALVEHYIPHNTDNAEPFPLQKGSCGCQVELMQRFLNRICYQRLTEDGYWGPQTDKAVQAYCTNATGYITPVWNKYWAMHGIGYTMSGQQFADMLGSHSEYLV